MLDKNIVWSKTITSKTSYFDLKFEEIWNYRDLLKMFVFKDFVTNYKQTILGPMWFFIQPLFTTIIYFILFGRLAGLSTDGTPRPLFYLLGIIFWTYFSECLIKVATVFNDNKSIFGKVYFPRLIKPLSIVISNLLKFFVQSLLFTLILIYYLIAKDYAIQLNWSIIFIPILIINTAILGLGIGLIITSLTTKYRDLVFLMTFGIQIFMYVTPVVYPLSLVNNKYGNYSFLFKFNPMTGILEGIRCIVLQTTTNLPYEQLMYSLCFGLSVLAIGILVFNKTEKNFMDTI